MEHMNEAFFSYNQKANKTQFVQELRVINK